MSLYLVTYSNEKPKTGHRPIENTCVVDAGSRVAAIRAALLMASCGDVWQIRAEWAGARILKAEVDS